MAPPQRGEVGPSPRYGRSRRVTRGGHAAWTHSAAEAGLPPDAVRPRGPTPGRQPAPAAGRPRRRLGAALLLALAARDARRRARRRASSSRPAPGGPPTGTALFWAAVRPDPAWPLLLARPAPTPRGSSAPGATSTPRRPGRPSSCWRSPASPPTPRQLDLSRALVVVGVPALALATLSCRYVAPLRLRRLRGRGHCTKRVVVVGRGGAVLELADRLGREHSAGLQVVGTCVTRADRARVAEVADVPVERAGRRRRHGRRLGADTIAVTSASETAAEYLRQLSWQLEGTGMELLVAPGLIEVAGPRLHIRPFEGLPLLSVEQPRFEGWRRVVKGGVDRSAALVALCCSPRSSWPSRSPSRLTSPGPVLYRQERVGINGRPFTM